MHLFGMSTTYDHANWRQTQPKAPAAWEPFVDDLFGAGDFAERPIVRSMELAGEALMLIAFVLVGGALITLIGG